MIEALDPAGVQLRVELREPPPARHRFDIVLALPRPKMLRRILRQCAEFGVAQLHLIHSARVEKSYWQSPLLQPDKLAEALRMGLERSRDTLAPTVQLHPAFARLWKTSYRGSAPAGPAGWRIMYAAGAGRGPQVPAVVMIGPEGGFVPFEVQRAEAVLAQRVGLGERILSVDTAFTTVLAQALGSGR